jgi:hypothetical protein
MKNILSLIMILFLAPLLMAQEKVVHTSKNYIKFNVPSLAISTISLFYERQISKKGSLQIGLRFTPERGLPFQSNVTNLVALAADSLTSNFYRTIRGNGLAIAPEYRYYTGKYNGRGFYLSPMVKYQSFGTNAVLNTLLSNGTKPFNAALNGSLSSIGVGGQFGVQFWAGKHICIDWMMLGLQYNRYNADIYATSNDFGLNLTEEQELYSKLAGVISSGLFSINPTVTNQKIGIAGAFGMVNFKTGLCIGYRF